MGYEQQGLSGIGTAKSYQEEDKVQRKETDLEGLLSKFEGLNKESQSITNRLESLSDRLRNEPVASEPENDKIPTQSGIVSNLNNLLTTYQRTISRNQNAIARLESII